MISPPWNADRCPLSDRVSRFDASWEYKSSHYATLAIHLVGNRTRPVAVLGDIAANDEVLLNPLDTLRLLSIALIKWFSLLCVMR